MSKYVSHSVKMDRRWNLANGHAQDCPQHRWDIFNGQPEPTTADECPCCRDGNLLTDRQEK